MDRLNVILKYEMVLNTLFRELKMSAALGRFVRALIIASKGEQEFEISQRELAKLYLGAESSSERAKVQNVRDNLKALKKWQEENRIELVKIWEGKQIPDSKGKFTYVKTKYQFSLLDSIVRHLYATNDEDLELRLQQSIEQLKSSYQRKRKKKYSHRHLVKKARRTIQTKLRKIFSLAEQIDGLHPVEYCNHVLSESRSILENLEDDYVQKQNRKKRLEAFEKRLSSAE